MTRLATAVLLLLFFAAPASAWWTKGWIPPCESGEVIARIQEKFAYADRKTFHWGVGIERVTHISEQPQILKTRRSLIARRYCQGTAWLSDGRQSEVVYVIESRQGFASIGYRVQSCLPGFDPWHVYDAWCRSIRP